MLRYAAAVLVVLSGCGWRTAIDVQVPTDAGAHDATPTIDAGRPDAGRDGGRPDASERDGGGDAGIEPGPCEPGAAPRHLLGAWTTGPDDEAGLARVRLADLALDGIAPSLHMSDPPSAIAARECAIAITYADAGGTWLAVLEGGGNPGALVAPPFRFTTASVPAVASATVDGWIVAWIEPRFSLRTLVFDAAGTPASSGPTELLAGARPPIAIATRGRVTALSFLAAHAPSIIEVASDGTARGPATRLSPSVPIQQLVVTSSGFAGLMFRLGDVSLLRLGADLTEVGSPVPVGVWCHDCIAGPGGPGLGGLALAASGAGEIAVLYRSTDGLTFARFDESGAALGSTALPVRSATGWPALGWDGRSFVAMWNDETALGWRALRLEAGRVTAMSNLAGTSSDVLVPQLVLAR